MDKFRLDESQGDVFSQIAQNIPANPEKGYARQELSRLRSASSETDRQMAAVALAHLAENSQLTRLTSIIRTTDEFQTGRRS